MNKLGVGLMGSDVHVSGDVREGAKTVSGLVAGVESAETGKPVKVINQFDE